MSGSPAFVDLAPRNRRRFSYCTSLIMTASRVCVPRASAVRDNRAYITGGPLNNQVWCLARAAATVGARA
jgi:hypothetical protein